MSTRYRKKPVEVAAIRWEGGDTTELEEFCGRDWTRGDAVETEYNDPEQVVVYDKTKEQWLYVPVGQWIVRGVEGEYYPCKHEVFVATYEPIDPDEDARIGGVGIPRDSQGKAIRDGDRVAFGDDPNAPDTLFGDVVGLGDIVVIDSGGTIVRRFHHQVTVVEK